MPVSEEWIDKVMGNVEDIRQHYGVWDQDPVLLQTTQKLLMYIQDIADDELDGGGRRDELMQKMKDLIKGWHHYIFAEARLRMCGYPTNLKWSDEQGH